MQDKLTIDDCEVLLAQGEHGLPERPYRLLVVFLRLDVPLLVVVVDAHPWLALGEAGMFTAVPLHWRAAIVACRLAEVAQHPLDALVNLGLGGSLPLQAFALPLKDLN